MKLSKLIKIKHKITPNRLIILAVVLVYLVLAWIYFGPDSIHSLGSHIFNNGADPQQFVWYYNWWPYAITHHLNPFISRYVWYPKGYNVSWSTSIPTLSLLMLPVTLLGGAVLSYNLVALLSPVMAALTMFALIKYITKNNYAAFLSGYIYGFSSFMLGQLLGHPHQYAIFILPLMILVYLLLLNRRIKPVYFVICEAVLLLMQTGISLEITLTFTLFAALFWMLAYWLSEHRALLRRSIKYIIYSFIVYIVALSPFIFFLLKGLSNLPKTIHPLIPFSLNLANLFIPTQLTLIGGNGLTSITRFYTGNIAENSAYVGLPLLLIMLYITIRYWQDKILRVSILTLIIVGIAALGPRLHLIGQTGASLWMPWALAAKIPLIDAAQPDRFALYFFLVISVVIGIWLAKDSKDRSYLRLKYILVLVGLVFIIPNSSYYSWSKPKLPAIFEKQNLSLYLNGQPNLLILPFNNSSIYYQYASHMTFTQTGGYVGFTPKDYATNPVVKALLSSQLPPNFNQLFINFVRQNHITKIIIIKPLTPPPIMNAISKLNWQKQTIGNSWLIIPNNNQ